MTLDDLDLPRPVLKPLDLQSLSIQELKEYILALKAEIDRAENKIEEKRAHRSGADSLFG